MTNSENAALMQMAQRVGEVTGAVESLRDEFVDFRTEIRASLRQGAVHFKQHDDEIAELKEKRAYDGGVSKGRGEVLALVKAAGKKPLTWVVVAVGGWIGLFGPSGPK